MVIRNGWYVWRIASEKPGFKGTVKWYLNVMLLILIRCTNIFTGPKRVEALTETLGRIYGLLTLVINKPKVDV